MRDLELRMTEKRLLGEGHERKHAPKRPILLAGHTELNVKLLGSHPRIPGSNPKMASKLVTDSIKQTVRVITYGCTE